MKAGKPLSKSSQHRCVVFCIEALTVGGAEQMLVAMGNQFVERGWRVHMICLSEPGELAAHLNPMVTLHDLHKRRGVDLQLPYRLRRLIRSIGPQAVNSHLWVANLWTRISLLGAGVPIFVTEHSRDTWKPLHYRILDRLLTINTHALVAVSADTADFYCKEIGVSDRQIRIINNGVDTVKYSSGNGQTLRSMWAPSNEFLVGTVGRLVAAKNHIRLLHMAQQLRSMLPAFRLVIVGDGPERGAVETAIKERDLGEYVVLAGARSDIADVLAAFDVFVLSSDREGHPLTALEAQAAGTPVVLTNAGGSADALAIEGEKRGGWLVDKDATQLANAVASLANDSTMRQSMASFAQQYALAHFDKEHMVDQYAELFIAASG